MSVSVEHVGEHVGECRRACRSEGEDMREVRSVFMRARGRRQCGRACRRACRRGVRVNFQCQCEQHAGEPCAALGPVVRKDVLRAVRLFRPALVAGDAVPAGLKKNLFHERGGAFLEFVEEGACGRVGVRVCVRGGNAVGGRIGSHVGEQGESDHGSVSFVMLGKGLGQCRRACRRAGESGVQRNRAVAVTRAYG